MQKVNKKGLKQFSTGVNYNVPFMIWGLLFKEITTLTTFVRNDNRNETILLHESHNLL